MADPTPKGEQVTACPRCPHPLDEHDGMGDCHHLDARTRTGFCRSCPPAADSTESTP